MKKNKILILGKGFIGSRLRDALGCSISGAMLSSYKELEDEVNRFAPKVLINCIGYTGLKNVDGCELNIDGTLFSNVFIPIMLAELAFRKKIKLVHISSGCIYRFDYKKDKPVREDELPDFYDLFYSRTKMYADRVLEVLPKSCNILIIRIRIPLDNRPHPRNLLTKLINYKSVIDLPNSVTYIPDFIKALKHLLKISATGIYNVVNRGGLRYPEFLDVYKKYVADFKYKVIDYKELNLVRTNLILSTRKLQMSGFKVRDIKEVYEECIKSYLKY